MKYFRLLITIAFLADEAVASNNPCVFCTRGQITQPEKPVHITGFEFIDSCGSFESLLSAFLTEDDPQCQQMQSLSALCGCPRRENACSLCPDGSSIAYPNKEVQWLASAFGGIIPTCDLVEAYTASLVSNDNKCMLLQAVSTYCGCPALPDACTYCDGAPLQKEFYDEKIPMLSNKESGITGTCEMLWETQYQLPRDGRLCKTSVLLTPHCGCHEGITPYYGTSTRRQQRILVWLPRTIGMVSLIASCLVLLHIFGPPKKRSGVYQQFIVLIVIFDIITSLVWIVGTAAVDDFNPNSGLSRGIYGASGTGASCRASGVFLLLGGTSIYLSVSLTVFYFLVIVRGMKEPRLRQLRLWLFGPPLAIGFTMAFAAMPYIRTGWSTCQPRVTPINEHLDRILVFVVIPLTLSTGLILALLLVIYLRIRQQIRMLEGTSAPPGRSARLNSQSGSSESEFPPDVCDDSVTERKKRSIHARLEREVFYQCISYAAAYGLTWPIYIVAQFHGEDTEFPFWFWILVVIIAPMQGLSNSMCYFRAYMSKAWKRNRRPSHNVVAVGGSQGVSNSAVGNEEERKRSSGSNSHSNVWNRDSSSRSAIFPSDDGRAGGVTMEREEFVDPTLELTHWLSLVDVEDNDYEEDSTDEYMAGDSSFGAELIISENIAPVR